MLRGTARGRLGRRIPVDVAAIAADQEDVREEHIPGGENIAQVSVCICACVCVSCVWVDDGRYLESRECATPDA